MHVGNNAIDHGLEELEERLACSKSSTVTLSLRTYLDAEELVISLEDDGRGIDWPAIAARAKERGLPYATHEDLELALFAAGTSTKVVASEVSGRGIGMAAVQSAVRDLGGRIVFFSEPGRGTRCEARVPHHAMKSRPVWQEART